MIDKPLNEITGEDIHSLIDNQVPESRTLDYKSKLTISDDKEKKEFCADVTALANTRGGDIIFGISEDNQKMPVEICGVFLDQNEDKIKTQINQILRSKVSPKLQDVDIRVLDLDGKQVMILRVGESIFSPHGVDYGNHYRFYIRNINSKDPMDVEELRGKFLESQSLEKQMDEFVSSRLADIASNQNDYLSNEYPFLTIHLIPYSAFNQKKKYSVQRIRDSIRKSESSPLKSYATENIFHDGIRLNYPTNPEIGKCFANYFVNGVVEQAGNNHIFAKGKYEGKTQKVIRENDMVKIIIDVINKTIGYYELLEIKGPLTIFLSIINAKEYKPSYANSVFFIDENQYIIDRNLISLPPLYVEDIASVNQENVPSMIRPLLDSLWNAFGFLKCQFYDEEGNFVIN